MAELARGTVLDRPWGKTLGALGLRGLSGELTLTVDGKSYKVAFDSGTVVGAASPIATDAAVRVALTANLITSTQVGDITRRIAAAPDRDELELLGEIARLTPDQVQRLRRRLVAQRAARTFSVDRGEFVVDDHVTVPVRPGAEVDIRTVVYLGARQNLSEPRLADELAKLGAWFQLKEQSLADLPYFGFSDADKPLLATLRAGADLAELELVHRDLGERTVRAIVYALACCNTCETQAVPRTTTGRKSPSQPPRSHSVSSAPTELKRGMERLRTPSGAPPKSSDVVTRTKGGSAPPATEVVFSRTQTPSSPPIARTQTPTSSPAPAEDVGFVRMKATSSPPPPAEGSGFIRTKSGTNPPAGAASQDAPTVAGGRRAHRASDSVATKLRREIDQDAARETEGLIAEKLALVDAKADHFELLGLPSDAAPEAIRDAFFALARKLHPDRLASLAISDPKRDAQRLFANINTAFNVLNDPGRRRDYLAMLERGGEAVVRAEEAKAVEIATRVMRAEEAYRRGEMALRRDQLEQALVDFTAAAELQPNEPDYQALLAWVKFAMAPDKKAVATTTRGALLKSIDQSTKSVTARFYLGRVERMLGREREALEHFQEVLRIKPGHAEASSEARVLESRLKAKR